MESITYGTPAVLPKNIKGQVAMNDSKLKGSRFSSIRRKHKRDVQSMHKNIYDAVEYAKKSYLNKEDLAIKYKTRDLRKRGGPEVPVSLNLSNLKDRLKSEETELKKIRRYQ